MYIYIYIPYIYMCVQLCRKTNMQLCPICPMYVYVYTIYAIYSLCPLYVLFSIALPATLSLCHIPEYTFPICSIFYSIVPASPIHHIFPIYI